MNRVTMLRSHYPDSRIEKEAATLAGNGYTVRLIVWDRGRVPSAKGAVDCELKRMKLKVRQDSAIVALWLPVWWVFVAFRLLVSRWDIVHAADFDTYLPALAVARIRRKPIVYDMFDFYADMFRYPPVLKPIQSWLARVDRFLTRFADAVIIADDSRVEQLGDRSPKRLLTIVNSPSEESCRTTAGEGEPDHEGLRIFYGGAVTDDRGIESMCRAIEGMASVRMTVMGPCSPAYEKRLRAVCAHNTNVELCLDWVPHLRIIEETMKADLLFALYDPKVPNNRYASPNKVFEAMMCAKPLIVSEGTSMAAMVDGARCGLIVGYDDVEALREAVLAMRDQGLAQEMGLSGRTAYEEKYSWPIMRERLKALYADVLGSRNEGTAVA